MDPAHHLHDKFNKNRFPSNAGTNSNSKGLNKTITSNTIHPQEALIQT
jgi:hypothetical protein